MFDRSAEYGVDHDGYLLMAASNAFPLFEGRPSNEPRNNAPRESRRSTRRPGDGWTRHARSGFFWFERASA